jgi:PEP-CTERM motif
MKTFSVSLLAVGTLTLAGSLSAAVVYDNTTQANLKTSAFRTGLEYGDEIKLTGTERFVTQFIVGYFGDFSTGSPTGTVRIYANDGTDAITGPQTALRPKTLLWESAPLALLANNQELVLSPNITVPDNFTWSIKFDGLANVVGNGAALSVVNPVTIGGVLANGAIGSYNDFWIKNGSSDESWALNILAGGSLPANYYARVTAVPEPSTMALAGLGLAGLLWAWRRPQAR